MTPELKEIKRLYRRYMNGAVAHSMRLKGASYQVNFGLTLPLLQQIAATIQPSADLAEELWSDARVRESLLLAPMIYPVAAFDVGAARRWVSEIPNVEVADFCCKFLFARLPYAPQLAEEWVESANPLVAYVAYRLAYALFDAEITTDWVSSVARHALPVASGETTVVALGARRWLFEGLQHPKAGRIILACLDECTDIDATWADNLRSLYVGEQ